jgi:hypothetical protein
MNPTVKQILAVLVGLASSVIAVLLLWPVAQLVVDKYFELDSFRSDNIIMVTVYLWVLIPALVGGFVCSLIAERKEFNHVLVLTLLSIAITVILFKDFVLQLELKNALIVMMFPLGFFTGARIAINYKKRKRKRLEKTTL